MIQDLLLQAHEYVEPTKLVGVYFLMRCGDVFYIGQSTNIDLRVAAHRADPRMREIDSIRWIDVAVTDLDAVEGALIRHLRPIGNTRRAPGDRLQDAAVLASLGIKAGPVGDTSSEQRGRRFLRDGLILRDLRRAKKMRQADVAAELGIGKASVCHWEKGWSRPGRDVCARLAQILGVESLPSFEVDDVEFSAHELTVSLSRKVVRVSVHGAEATEKRHAKALETTEVSNGGR